MLIGESVKEKKTAALFVVTFIFIGYASHNTRGTKLRHIRPHNGLQGFTCFDVVGRVSAVLMG